MDGGVEFPQTLWGRVRQAAGNESTAVTDLVGAYRRPLERFLLHHGIAASEAEDLVQDVFLKLFERNLLQAADEKKGRFRSFLLGITKNVVGNWLKKTATLKRGAAEPVLSLDAPAGEDGRLSLADLVAGDRRDETFDRLWMDHLVQRAMARLEEECARENWPYHRALALYLRSPDSSYRSVAEALGATEPQVKNHIHRGKKKLIELIRSEIARTCSSPDEFQEELKYLSGFLES
jgi:RNA polymerase sigma-70 factor (ECF subfamily)